MAMIRHARAAGIDVPILLLLSARIWEDILYRDELFDFEKRLSGFTLVLTLTREPSRRPGDFGRRTDAAMMAEVLERLPIPPKHVFICGSNPFVSAAADGTIAAGVPASLIRTERYGD